MLRRGAPFGSFGRDRTDWTVRANDCRLATRGQSRPRSPLDMTDTTRAQFLTRAGKGGLALVAGGSILGFAEGTAFASGSRITSDASIAKVAATAELLAIDFYTRAIASNQL